VTGSTVVDPAWPFWAEEPTSDGGGPVWVAADESGSTGENLTDLQGVFAHASVRIDDEDARHVLAELRERAGATQAPEAKFSQFAKTRGGLEVLAAALAPGGSLAGRVVITVADKHFLIVSKMIDLLVEEEAHEQGIDLYADGIARDMAVTLFTDGPRDLGEFWEPLNKAFVSLARATQRGVGEKETVASFFDRLEHARRRCRRRSGRSVESLLQILLATRVHADALVRSAVPRGSGLYPGLDPLVTMLPMTLWHAYNDHGPVRFLHDEQKLLTSEFARDFFPRLWNVHPDLANHVPPVRVAEFWTGNSRRHSSIQLADLAASAGRVTFEAVLGKSSVQAGVLADAVAPLIREGVTADLQRRV